MAKRNDNIIKKHLDELTVRYPVLSGMRDALSEAAFLLLDVYRKGGKVLVCGNGGSAADADHIVGELMKGFVKTRPLPPKVQKQLVKTDAGRGGRIASLLQQALPAISLTSQSSLISAFTNDVQPDLVFAQQVAGYGKPDDLFWGLSTSGNAGNVVNAAVTAQALGLKVLGMTGNSGGLLKPLTHVCLCMPETETYKVQELHLPVYHALCLITEDVFFGD